MSTHVEALSEKMSEYINFPLALKGVKVVTMLVTSIMKVSGLTLGLSAISDLRRGIRWTLAKLKQTNPKYSNLSFKKLLIIIAGQCDDAKSTSLRVEAMKLLASRVSYLAIPTIFALEVLVMGAAMTSIPPLAITSTTQIISWSKLILSLLRRGRSLYALIPKSSASFRRCFGGAKTEKRERIRDLTTEETTQPKKAAQQVDKAALAAKKAAKEAKKRCKYRIFDSQVATKTAKLAASLAEAVAKMILPSTSHILTVLNQIPKWITPVKALTSTCKKANKTWFEWRSRNAPTDSAI